MFIPQSSFYNSWANFHVLSFRKRFIFSKVKIKSRNEFGFSPETEMGLMRTFDAYYQDQPKIVKDEKKSSESLYKTFGNNKGTYLFINILRISERMRCEESANFFAKYGPYLSP